MVELFKLVGVIAIDGLKKAEKDLGAFERKVSRVVKPIEKFGKNVSTIGKQFGRTLSAPIALAGAAVLKFGAEFEESMTNSLAIMGDVSQGMRSEMERVAMTVGKDLKGGADAAAQAYFFLASAGKDAERSMALLPRVAKFATAGNFDMALATDLLTDAQSALGLSSKDAARDLANMTRLSDVLVGANTLANASVREFSESLTNKAGAALRLLKKDTEEGVAVLAAFADQGTKGVAAGDALNIVLRDLQKASIKNREAFADAGVAVFDQAGKMRNMADIVLDLENRLGGMSDEQKRVELSMLGFQDKSISHTMALLGTSEAIREYENRLRSMAGITDEVSKKQLKSFNAVLRRAKNQLINAAIGLSQSLIPVIRDDFVPALEKGIQKLQDAVDWFGNLSEGQKNATIKLVAFGAALGPVLISVGSMISSISILVTTLKAAKLAMVAFNATLALNPIGAVAIAVTGLIAGIVTLTAKQLKLNQAMKDGKHIGQGLDDRTRALSEGGIRLLIESFAEARRGTLSHSEALEAHSERIHNLASEARVAGYIIEGNTEAQFRALKAIEAGTLAIGESTKATGENTDATGENADAVDDNTDALDRHKDAREELLEQYREQYQEITLSERQLIDLEERNALKRAKSLNATEEELGLIHKLFAAKRSELVKATAEEELRELEKVRAERSTLVGQYTAEYEQLTRSERELITLEETRALERAKSLNASEQELETIRMAFAARRKQFEADEREELRREIEDHEKEITRIEEEENRKRDQSDKKLAREKADRRRTFKQLVIDSVNTLAALGQKSTADEVTRIDMKLEKEKAAIMQSTMSEEQKQAAIAALEEQADAHKKELLLRQAKRDKAQSIFSAILATAAGVAKALTLIPPVSFVMAGITAALGAAQVALIASQPLPELAEGGLIRKRPGGLHAVVGEGNDDETVLPMRKGAFEIADRIMDRIGRSREQMQPAPAGMAGAMPAIGGTVRETHNHFHVGTLIADRNGLKELERRMKPIRAEEAQRRGE